jgi:hypothetical protein
LHAAGRIRGANGVEVEGELVIADGKHVGT